ncbi:MAG: aminoacetone oxidase family FAD-binding enzyme [Candidatus Gracilibacteria bacterium]|nr:aminoacetone oxidase family FAD-binding enzyme [Candidatus Gracilibacteria bacterium]
MINNIIYDVIFIGGGASSLFAGAHSDKKIKTLILEKTGSLGTKLLLSGGGRANITNMNIDEELDYFGQNKKALKSIFSKYNNWDLMAFASENNLELVEEDRGRMLLKSGKSKDFLELLLKKNRENNVEIKLKKSVKSVKKDEKNDIFIIKTEKNEEFFGKKVVISTGGRSFMDLGTTGDGYNFAGEFGIKSSGIYRGLCGITCVKKLEDISGTSVKLKINIKYKDKVVYSESGPLLFTHFGLSGPIIFNSVLKIGEYLDKIGKNTDDLKGFSAELFFDLENTSKKVIKFFDLSQEKSIIELDLHSFRSWREAKVTGGGILLDELDNNLQSKKVQNLFFIGEILDITGKTGGYNLQLAFSTGYIVMQYIKSSLGNTEKK